MAQPNSEQYRGEPERQLLEKSGSSVEVEDVMRGEEEGQRDPDLSGLGELRQPPTSQVGYGGGDDRYVESLAVPKQGHWEERKGGDDDEDSRYAQDRRGESDSGTTTEERRSQQGGYPEEEGYNVGSYGDASSKSSETYGRGDVEGSSAGYGSEVRNGVPHRVTSDGVASGTGIGDSVKAAESTDPEQYRDHQTGVAPSSGEDTPYSQLHTQLDGPKDAGNAGNSMGGMAVDHQNEDEAVDHVGNEGFLKRLMHKLPGNNHKQDEPEVTDCSSGVTGVNSDDGLPQNDEAKPAVLTKLKDKLLPNKDKHRDEINPEIFE